MAMTTPGKAIFFDKDGTLIEDIPFNVNPRLVRFQEGAKECLQLLDEAGFQIFIVSNQAGLAQGKFGEKALIKLIRTFYVWFSRMRVPLAGFYFCPHDPDGSVSDYAIACDCHKPLPGLLLKASEEHDIDLSRSWVIGDILHDIEAAHRAGARGILLDNGNETEWQLSLLRTPDASVGTLLEAAELIINNTVRKEG